MPPAPARLALPALSAAFTSPAATVSATSAATRTVAAAASAAIVWHAHDGQHDDQPM